MELIFEDNNLRKDIKKTVKEIISRNGRTSGNITVEYMDDDDLEAIDVNQEFKDKYASCEIYLVYEKTGFFSQPISLVAVVD